MAEPTKVTVKWTKTEVTSYTADIPLEAWEAMQDTYEDTLAEYEDDATETNYAVTDRDIDGVDLKEKTS